MISLTITIIRTKIIMIIMIMIRMISMIRIMIMMTIFQRMGEYETLKERRFSAPLKRPPGLFPLPAVIWSPLFLLLSSPLFLLLSSPLFLWSTSSLFLWSTSPLFLLSSSHASSWSDDVHTVQIFSNVQAGTYGPTPDNSRQVSWLEICQFALPQPSSREIQKW